MDAKRILVIAGIVLVALLLFGLVLSQVSKQKEQEKRDELARLEAQKQAELNQARAEAEAQRLAQEAQEKVLRDSVSVLQAEKEKLEAELEQKLEEEPTGTSSFAYVEDDLILGEVVSDIYLSDNKLSSLLDTEVEFDGELYNVEESVKLSGLEVALGDEDYKGEAYLEVPVEGFFYIVEFDDSLPTGDIGVDEEYLSFQFLGKEVTVKEWDGTKLVFTTGTEYTLKEGEELVVEDNKVVVNFISENEKVSLSVNGETATLSEGQTKELGGVDVHVESVLINSRAGLVTLKLGKDVFETVYLGDEYEEDSFWAWYVDEANRKIGLYNTEEFKYFDEDEDFNAFGYGQSLALPNDRVEVTFVGLDVVEYDELFMDLSSKEGTEYVRLKGEFESGLEKYTRLYISKTTSEIFGLDEENDLEALGDRVELKGSDFEILVSDEEVLVVEKGLSVALASFDKGFGYAKLDGVVLSGEEDHLGSVGIRVKNVEDSSEDEKFTFSVPEEQVFASLGFN